MFKVPTKANINVSTYLHILILNYSAVYIPTYLCTYLVFQLIYYQPV